MNGEVKPIATKSHTDIPALEEFVGNVISEFGGKDADTCAGCGIIPMMAVSRHTTDGSQRCHTITCN